MLKLLNLLCLMLILNSCAHIKSNLYINPEDSFILGKNEHGPFKVKLTNYSKNPLEVRQSSLQDEQISIAKVYPNQKVRVSVQKNYALSIHNTSKDTARAQVKITGDTGLAMQYAK
ncbi:MAG: hypothetical protein KA251_05200 [Saprospiraceae bacterium]|nr:hypothetical protein [Candidatus Vicinibacter affinis]MBP6172978.1 hypothetical protein [Saprospiraceae bacterium]MBK6572868.1 hypothetical protein [Candidatus Vicinibacter affinis]MBK7302627.1 hypothetical protein [Candidatus Vicinibacter affinis]MBK7798553.1 hypothetical protein [Candidatus Vicinibacter affinis]